MIRNYLSLIKFSHTIFAMPFALIGFSLGIASIGFSVVPGWNDSVINSAQLSQIGTLLIKIIACMVFARTAAMAFNRYLDRDIDARNPRTASREIPKGKVSPAAALALTVICSLLFVFTCYFINRICFLLSPVALLIILGYSYTKRFTSLSHLVLGLGLSLAPIGAYLAVTGEFDILPLIFSLAVIFWVSGFDIIYTLQDDEFDRQQDLFSIPASLGRSKALRFSQVLHALTTAAIIYAGIYAPFGWLYWIGAVVFIGMLMYQHSLVKADDLSRVNIAFMTANGVASIVFAIFVIMDVIIGLKFNFIG